MLEQQPKSFDYIAEANVTASNAFHGDKVALHYFEGVLDKAINALEQLDQIKKALFYGREVPGVEYGEVVQGCQRLPLAFDNENSQRGELLLHSIIGLATEAGELLELARDVVFKQQPFDDINFIEEIGDGFWYAAIGLNQVRATFGDVQHRNIAKLRHRFPNKFSEYDANNRDLFGERQILENASGQTEAIKMLAEIKCKQYAEIDNWVHDQINNVLWGNVSGHPRQAKLIVMNPTAYCHTSRILELNASEGYCETKNTIYRLLKPVDKRR